MALKQLAHSQTNIPLPHHIELFLTTIDKWIPFPSKTTNQQQITIKKGLINETNETGLQSNGIYGEIAHILNRLIFTLFTLIYIFNILTVLLYI